MIDVSNLTKVSFVLLNTVLKLLVPLYFNQELNVKKLTVSSDKDKYGIHLKAEPDNQTLGRRLKGAFKQVSQAVKGEL